MPYVKSNRNYRKRSKRSRARKRRFFAVLVLVVIAVLAIAIARRVLAPPAPSVPVARATPTAAPATPSPPPWTAPQVARVRAALSSAFAPAANGALRVSLVVIDARGNVLFSQGEHTPATPASVQKLIVSYTSLNVLGPMFHFDTILAGEHGIGNDGTLQGPLWLVGSGDPSFRSNDLRAGVETLARGGLRSIPSGIVVDATAISGPEINPYWSASDANEDYQAPTSGISIDGDNAEFRVYGRSPGQPARVAVVPSNGVVRTFGSVETGGGDDVVIASWTPNHFHLSGHIPPDTEEKFWLPVHGIAHYAGSVLSTMLRDAGVSVGGGISTGAAPLDSVTLWMHRSAPLPVLLRHMLYVSDNHYAEQFLRTLGGEAGTPDDRNGIAVETEFLRSRNIPTAGLHLVDGSGLAESNRVSALTLARILSDAELRGGGAELYPLLADTHEGTLKYYDFGAAAGRVHGKTGHLNDADSLAGYIDTKHHGRLAFAFMINDSPGDPDIAYIRALDFLAGM